MIYIYICRNKSYYSKPQNFRYSALRCLQEAFFSVQAKREILQSVGARISMCLVSSGNMGHVWGYSVIIYHSKDNTPTKGPLWMIISLQSLFFFFAGLSIITNAYYNKNHAKII